MLAQFEQSELLCQYSYDDRSMSSFLLQFEQSELLPQCPYDQREYGILDARIGAPYLFRYKQFIISITFMEMRVVLIPSPSSHFFTILFISFSLFIFYKQVTIKINKALSSIKEEKLWKNGLNN